MKDGNFAYCGNYHEVAIFTKGELTSVVALSRSTSGIVLIGRNDPRSQPAITNSPQCCFNTAKARFQNAIQTSVDNGWSLVWRGFPYGKTEAR